MNTTGNDDAALRTDWFDGHLDLAWVGLAQRDLDQPAPPDSAVSWPDLAEAGITMAFGTIFTEMNGDTADPASYPAGDVTAAGLAGRAQLKWYREQERRCRINLARRFEDLEAGRRPSIILLMECADPIKDASEAAWWVEQGVRMVGLSWGRGSRFAGGNAAPGGLTADGRALVAAFEDLGVAHDCSHLSRASFDELLASTTGPICASHSNAGALVGSNPRHLEDSQYAAIAARDGIVGLNLYGRFLRSDGEATIEDCLDHVEHAAGIVGRHRVGLGSDADGGFPASELPRGLQRLTGLPMIARGLAERGWADEDISGFQRENWKRWLQTVPSLTPCHQPERPPLPGAS